MNFTSYDFGAFVFGRKILKKFPQAILHFYVKHQGEVETEILENNFWDIGLKKILKTETRFGRIGIFFDRKNKDAEIFFKNLNTTKYPFFPKEKKRAESRPRVSYFETQILWDMANEDYTDSVEFRRLARKYIRKAKTYNVDTIFFVEAIFGADKTRKILQHIAGTQIKLFFPSDFLFDYPNFFVPSKKDQRDIRVYSGDDAIFTKKIAENILRTKLKDSCIQTL